MAHSRSRARRLVGDIKWRVVDRWPYAVLKPIAQRRRDRYRAELARLPSVPTARAAVDAEVHMLCGAAHVDMGIWASWSLLRFFRNPVLYVHSDGTLAERDLGQWRDVIPGAVLVPSTEADDMFAAEYADDFPTLARWRSRYWCARQVIDYHLFGQAEAFLGMDSDVLCFRRPREVEDALGRQPPAFRWNRDLGDYYSAEREVLASVTGLPVPAALNGGFLVYPRFSAEDFAFLDATLLNLESASIDIFHWAMAQTLFAICAARNAQSAPLPAPYDVRFGRAPADLVARHYVGLWNVRPKYFLEGVPRLVSELTRTSPASKAA
jgi:hypothetical protein